ncbi:hypothetical protein ACFSJQ_17025 [Vibrio olivae]|uniref:Uncharacterized protein n=1 Tax=Vibrio olivae TaxID=1243002 RepID=A0ABV5HQR7_9VIBR
MVASTTLLAPMLSLIPLPIPSDQSVMFTHLSASGYAQGNEIYPLIMGKQGGYVSSDHAYTLNQGEVGVQYGDFSVSLFSRYEWYLKFNPDTMSIYAGSLEGTDLDLGREYQIMLDAEHLYSHGLRLGWSHDWSPRFTTYLSVSYLQAQDMLSGTLQGDAQRDVFGQYQGLLNLNYVYTDDVLFNRTTNAPKSDFGYSSDIGFNWQPSDHVFISAWVQDAFNAIRWNDLPRTQAYANSAISITDDQGNVSIRPIVFGVSDSENYTQHLPTKYYARTAFLYGNGALGVKGLYVDGLWLTDIEWFAHWTPQFSTQVSVNTQSHALGLKANWHGFYLGLRSDDLDYQAATHLELNTGFSIAL